MRCPQNPAIFPILLSGEGLESFCDFLLLGMDWFPVKSRFCASSGPFGGWKCCFWGELV